MTTTRKPRKIAGRLVFDGDETGYSVADPKDETLHDAIYTATHAPNKLTKQALSRILAAADAYIHFAAHPADDESILAQLREVREAARS